MFATTSAVAMIIGETKYLWVTSRQMQAMFFFILIDVNFSPSSQYVIEEVAERLRYDFFGIAKQSNS